MANEGLQSAWPSGLLPEAPRPPSPPPPIVYPESDGEPLSDNTKQMRWIVVLFGNLSALYRERADVFVAGDCLWYPEEGHPKVRRAPDVFVVFGRPKGDRGSYRQWEENNVPLTVVFEVVSPRNDAFEMADKLAFYDEHQVEEYYVYDPDTDRLMVYRRGHEVLRRIWPPEGLVSPRLGIRFDLSGNEMVVFYPDGQPFLSFEELAAEREKERQRADKATQDANEAREETNKAREETNKAREETSEARQETNEARRRLARLAELTRKVLRQEASADERQELERLAAEPPS